MTTEQAILTDLSGLLGDSPARILKLKWNQIPVKEIDRGLANIYRQRNLQPAWVSVNGPGKKAATLLSMLRQSASEGLEPADYPISIIEQLWNHRASEALAKLDIALTSGLIAYVNDLAGGRLRVVKEDPTQFVGIRRTEIDPLLVVGQALIASDLRHSVQELAPVHPQYRKLRAALQQYRQIAADGGWPTVPDGPALRPGDVDNRIRSVRGRLFISGDLVAGRENLTEKTYDEVLITAVKRFQGRHGLVSDGVIGNETLDELNVSAAQRVRQIELNMERWRWLDIDMLHDYVLVDIAGFQLYKVRQGAVELQMPVIVGKQYDETPVFSDRIKYIEFNPYWNVPPSIAREEMLLKLRENPGYLGAQRIRLFNGWHENALEIDPYSVDWTTVSSGQMGSFKLRQEPGPSNSLGRMKFVFPNHHSVYLHDTPNRDLFWREKRAFSHGCVRVAKPTELAIGLLGGNQAGWNQQRIESILQSGQRQIVHLDEPVAVHIAYQTAWVDDYGRMLFPRDIYGRDAKLAGALYDAPSVPRNTNRRG